MLTRENISKGLIGLAALFVTGTLLWLLCSWLWTYSSVRTSGRVVQLVQRHDTDVDYYCPVFVFRDADGLDHTNHSLAGSNPPRFPVGTRVSVLYQPWDPSNAHIEDPFVLWIAPLILMAISVFYGAVGYVIGRRPQRSRREQSA
jgi:hypothetical protein